MLLAVVGLVACGGRQRLSIEGDWAEPRTLTRVPVVVAPVQPGFAEPYDLDGIISTFGDCRDGGRRQHNGIDIKGLGENGGLGTPVFSMAPARIISIHRPEDEPRRFGDRDNRRGTVIRGGQELPRSLMISGYGRVNFFTRDYGSARTGVMIITRVTEGALVGHQIRYMHLGEVHPELRAGDIVEAGQEIGVMGGTAVLDSSPHVHFDIETPDGVRVDPAPFLGLEPDRRRCR